MSASGRHAVQDGQPPDPTGRSRGDAIGSVGHELRSPLTSVLGYAQLLGADSLTATQQGYVDVIERNGRRLLRLIDDLVVSARLSTGELDIDHKETDLSRLCRDCADVLGPTARAAGLTLTVLASGPVPVTGDPELLAQAMNSVLDDAIRRTPRGGTVTVTVTGPSPAGAGPGQGPTRQALVEVADTGQDPGPDDVERLTRRPSDVAYPGWAHGLALGLPVAEGIVAAHGGTVGVGTTPGGGTTVTVSLPMGSSKQPAGPSGAAGSTPR